MILKANNIKLGYDKLVIQVDSLLIDKPAFIFLLGKNGSGKSTLLKSMSGLLSPLSGEIYINKRPISDIRSTELSKKLRFVQSNASRVEFVNVFDYVAMGRMPYTGLFGKLNDHDKGRVDLAMHSMGIKSLESRMITALSDGEFQKVLIAQAICQDSDALLIDEPAAHLDIGAKAELFHLLAQQVSENNKTIVLATHEIKSALKLSDAIWISDKGKLMISSSDKLLASNHLNQIFGNEYISF